MGIFKGKKKDIWPAKPGLKTKKLIRKEITSGKGCYLRNLKT